MAAVVDEKCAELLGPAFVALKAHNRLNTEYWQTPWGNDLRFQFRLASGGSGSLTFNDKSKELELFFFVNTTYAPELQNALIKMFVHEFDQQPQISSVGTAVHNETKVNIKGLQDLEPEKLKQFIVALLDKLGEDQPITPPPTPKPLLDPEKSQYFLGMKKEFPRFSILAELRDFNWGEMLTPWGNFYFHRRTSGDRKVTFSLERGNGDVIITWESLDGQPLIPPDLPNVEAGQGSVKFKKAQNLTDQQILDLLK